MSYRIEQADVLIDLAKQRLYLPKLGQQYLVSTGKNGIGEAQDSGKTPRGWHKVAEKFGSDMPMNTVFKARQPTGEIYSAELGASLPERDWILTRILWLEGLEPGFNQGEGRDTYWRYIYIHGTPEQMPMGRPESHGCIRMHNQDLLAVFDALPLGALVYLSEHGLNRLDLNQEIELNPSAPIKA